MRTESAGNLRVLHRPARVAQASIQGTLALELTPQQDPPEVDLVSSSMPHPGRAAQREFERFAARIVQAVVEIAGGERPVSQVLRWTSPVVYQDLGRRAQVVARAVGKRPGQGGIQGSRPQVAGLHTCFVTDDVAEVGARVRYGPRSRAVAARFERHRDRWICTALEFA